MLGRRRGRTLESTVIRTYREIDSTRRGFKIEPTETEGCPRPKPPSWSNTATTNCMAPVFFYLSIILFPQGAKRLEYDASYPQFWICCWAEVGQQTNLMQAV